MRELRASRFIWTLAAMGTIVISGWLLTNYLGEIYNENVQADAGADLNLLASRLASETAIAEGMVKLLAAAPSVQSLLTDRSSTGQRMLDSTVEAFGAKRGFILDRTGTVVAMAGNHGGTLNVRPTYAGAPFFRKSIAGEGSHAFSFDAVSGSRDYNTNYPVRADTGEVVGVAVLAKSLHVFEEDLRYYEGAYFLLDPSGVVVLTNRPEFMLRTFWPVPAEAQSELSRQFGRLDYRPILKQEITSPAWMLVDGARAYVARRLVDHGQWSLAVLKAPERIYASRVMGIAITLLTTIIALVFLLGRERAFHDRVQMDKRLELQEMASDLRFRATTDPLTSLNNRLKFNEAMSTEISRAERYNTPLCLVLYDIDHFKLINDTHGHTAGDDVLINLSRFVASQIRNVDVLARWGGEEFAILLPEANTNVAFQLAEKLRESISINPFDEAGTVTCSFGIAQFASGDTPRALVARADKALYQAKIRGRNRVETAPPRVSAQRAAGEESAA